MMKKYVFHYNGSEEICQEKEREYLEEHEMIYHEHLMEQDGNTCMADIEDASKAMNDFGPAVEAYFDDGNELTVYLSELEEI